MKKELAYLLGFFYADGYLFGSKNKYPAITLVKDDIYPIEYCLDTIGIKYTRKNRYRKNSKREQSVINLLKQDIFIDIFVSVLSDKINMNSVLNSVDKENIPYFIRGFFDGDGNICHRQASSSILSLYGSFDQNWSLIFELLKELNIKFSYRQYIRKNGKHKSSFVCITNKIGINTFFEYIYPNRSYDFGLIRKFKILDVTKSLIKKAHNKDYSDDCSKTLVKNFSNS